MDKVYQQMNQEKLDRISNSITACVQEIATYHYCKDANEIHALSVKVQRGLADLTFLVSLYNDARQAEQEFTKLYNPKNEAVSEQARLKWANISDTFDKITDETIKTLNE